METKTQKRIRHNMRHLKNIPSWMVCSVWQKLFNHKGNELPQVSMTIINKLIKSAKQWAVSVRNFFFNLWTGWLSSIIPYFIEYKVHTSIARTWISWRFLAKKKYFYFSRIISKEIIIASLFILKIILKPFSTSFHV